MNVVTQHLAPARERRLWPVAVLLVAALVAVPVLLARSDRRAAAARAGPVDDRGRRRDRRADRGRGHAEDRGRRRRVLGVRKNPFAAARRRRRRQADQPSDSAPPQDTRHGRRRAAPAARPPAVEHRPGGAPGVRSRPRRRPRRRSRTSRHDLTVRFGDASERARRTHRRSSACSRCRRRRLPAARLPGPDQGRQEGAMFLVDAALEVDGDGDLQAAPEQLRDASSSRSARPSSSTSSTETGNDRPRSTSSTSSRSTRRDRLGLQGVGELQGRPRAAGRAARRPSASTSTRARSSDVTAWWATSPAPPPRSGSRDLARRARPAAFVGCPACRCASSPPGSPTAPA